MKHPISLRSFLGLTQDDMAQLLGIGRSQWAMFETGKRDLPTPAMLLLSEIMEGVSQQSPAGKRTELPSHHAQMEQYVATLLTRNKFWNLSIERKLDKATAKQEVRGALVQVAKMLTDKPIRKSASWLELVNKISAKAAVREVKGVPALLRYEFKLELLDLERRHLEASLAKFKALQENPTQ